MVRQLCRAAASEVWRSMTSASWTCDPPLSLRVLILVVQLHIGVAVSDVTAAGQHPGAS